MSGYQVTCRERREWLVWGLYSNRGCLGGNSSSSLVLYLQLYRGHANQEHSMKKHVTSPAPVLTCLWNAFPDKPLSIFSSIALVPDKVQTEDCVLSSEVVYYKYNKAVPKLSTIRRFNPSYNSVYSMYTYRSTWWWDKVGQYRTLPGREAPPSASQRTDSLWPRHRWSCHSLCLPPEARVLDTSESPHSLCMPHRVELCVWVGSMEWGGVDSVWMWEGCEECVGGRDVIKLMPIQN